MNQILQYKKLKQEKRIRSLVIQDQSCPGILGHTVYRVYTELLTNMRCLFPAHGYLAL